MYRENGIKKVLITKKRLLQIQRDINYPSVACGCEDIKLKKIVTEIYPKCLRTRQTDICYKINLLQLNTLYLFMVLSHKYN